MNAIQTTFSLLYVIRKHRLLKNGEASIYLRITVNGEVADITTKRSVRPEMWDQRRECSLGKLHRDKELNHYLETIKTRLYQIHREFEIDGKRITAKALRDSFYGKDEDSKTLGDVYREHNKKCRALIGIDYSRSTVEKFDTSLSHLIEYIQYQYGKDDILLSELNGLFVTDFDFYLKTVRKCQNNSSIKHLKNLKKVVRIALANDWIKKDPFFGIQFKHEETHVEFLTQEELERIMNKEFELPPLELVRDIFVFCSFTALAFIDVKNLTPDHLMKDNNGALWIRKPRQKTGNMSNIPVLSVTKKLIDKYKYHPECIEKGVLLPVLSNQKLNSYLKEITDLCGIKKKLTTHVARHTFATETSLANGVPIETISKMMGHSEDNMTKRVYQCGRYSVWKKETKVEQSQE